MSADSAERLDILFLARSLERGGAERQLIVLAAGLKRRGHRVAVVLFYPNGPLTTLLEEAGVEIISLDKRGRWDIFSFLSRLYKLLQQRNPDVLHGYLAVPNILCALLKYKFPEIRMVLGVRASDMQLDNYDFLSRISYTMERWLSDKADLVITNSYAGKEHACENGYPAEKITVIQNGIDTQRFDVDRTSRIRVRKELGITDDRVLIGMVGRLDPMKGYETFIEAASRMHDSYPGVRFLCVGSGPESYRQMLVAESIKTGLSDTILWLDSFPDMAALYNSFDLFTLSSHYGEGFPNVVGEAMACGAPCIVTDVGDAADVVNQCGWVVSPMDATALLEGWKSALSTEKEVLASLSTSARERIVSSYSSEMLIEKSESRLLELCS